MSDISENLIQAIDLIAKAVPKTGAELTQGTIESVISEDSGTYRIKCGNQASFIASTMNTSIHYSAGESVYILVQDGDYSKRKLILGGLSKATAGTYDIVIDSDNETMIIS